MDFLKRIKLCEYCIIHLVVVLMTPACLLARLPACLLACLLACLFACLLACLPACLPACLLACLPLCLPACLPAYLPACLPAFLSACLQMIIVMMITMMTVTIGRSDFPLFITSIITTSTWVSCRAPEFMCLPSLVYICNPDLYGSGRFPYAFFVGAFRLFYQADGKPASVGVMTQSPRLFPVGWIVASDTWHWRAVSATVISDELKSPGSTKKSLSPVISRGRLFIFAAIRFGSACLISCLRKL